MDSLKLSTRTSCGNCFSTIQFISHTFHHANKPRIISFNRRKPGKSLVFASKDGSELDEWDRMELKFGRMIGEDPKITLAKIMGRKSNPDVSYLEIEKLLENKKSKMANDEIEEELLFDASEKNRSTKSLEGLNLVRPVPKRGNEFEATDKPLEANYKSLVQGLDLVRPSPMRGIKFEASDKPANDKSHEQTITKATQERKSSLPNVILRKPSSFKEDENGKPSRFGMKPNLSLKMGKEQQKKGFNDMTLLRKPEQFTNSTDIEDENDHLDSSDEKTGVMNDIREKNTYDATLFQKPELVMHNLNDETDYQMDKGSGTEFQADMWYDEKSFNSDGVSWSDPEISTYMTLIEKPKRW